MFLGETLPNTCLSMIIVLMHILGFFKKYFSASYRGSVSNMLLTSCKDNICRLWVETVLPEDGLVNLSQLDPQANHPKFRTHRHKHRFMQRLKHMK